ncbi:RNA polymerase sigma factor SigE [Streptomyces sp. PTM05]|uniref:RNA polymerase sigma factor SigE n=1 Tax=Streptantibioticus parmotrematis TaxID=2873249 RepID=A0ABS7QML6_9ACTN|nr:RNA polymerase sigma factor SigE [Streptantibioticus parmotrematis]MBY8884178.1 RNA polymerase sigma factor SigE [Streptantibioticus parmotrematis]
MVGALLDTTRATRGGAAVDGDRKALFRRLRGHVGQPKSVNETADSSTAASGAPAAATTATASFATDGDTWTPPSWEEIVSTHSARVYRLAYRLTGNQHDAEDLTQEVFVRVFRSLSTYTPGTFEGWLHRITTNLFLDMVRRRQRIRFDALGDDAAERLPSREPSPAQHFSDTHFDADVQQALDTLAPEFRAAVVLCDIEGLSYEEIAATLGVKLGTVRSRIHRGRSHLRSALKHRAPAARPGRAEAQVPVGAGGSGGAVTRGRS